MKIKASFKNMYKNDKLMGLQLDYKKKKRTQNTNIRNEREIPIYLTNIIGTKRGYYKQLPQNGQILYIQTTKAHSRKYKLPK